MESGSRTKPNWGFIGVALASGTVWFLTLYGVYEFLIAGVL